METKSSVRELAAVFLRLGVSSFGGPAAHIANMHDEFVKRRRWFSSGEFLDLLGATNMIPGPNSTEMAIHIGYDRAGIAGLLAAGICFITPAALFVGAIAVLYVRFGTVPQFEAMLYGIKPVAIVVILRAILDLGRTAFKSRFLFVLGLGSVVANALGAPELVVLFGAGLISIAWHRSWGFSRSLALVPPQIFLYFFKVGSVLFGSGYLLVALLRADLVEKLALITERQLIDAIAIGQITPGPLFTTATFVGYLLAGPSGAIAATIGIFLPAFVLVAATHRFIRRMRSNPWAQSALDGINVAAVALMVVVTGQLARSAIFDVGSIFIAIAAAILLWRFRVSSAWLVLGAAAAGFVLFGVSSL